MKFFKKATALQRNQEAILSSPSYHYTISSDFESLQHHQKGNTLTNTMHLFEEKSKYIPKPVTGPSPIKANGAIVVNRPPPPSHSCDTIRSLPLYLQDEEYDDEEENEEEMKMMSMTQDDGNTSSEEEINVIEIVHKENKRLMQQILVEREQYEKWRLSQDKFRQELTFAHNTIKNLQIMTDRFQKLLLPQINSNINKKSRRQSTGVSFDSNNNQQQIITSYERKLQILLNEIDAMEIQEKNVFQYLTLQKNENEELARRLGYKEDVIKQLTYDLQYERIQRRL